MKCYVCGDEAVKRHGRSNLCLKHRRFIQMQRTAKQYGKYVPSLYELERVVPDDMRCPDCGTVMNWADSGNRSSGAVLQHYREKGIGIVCLACNTKHGLMPGDSYCDVPHGYKLCRSCKTIKPLDEFGKRGKLEGNYPKSKCKSCELEAHKLWRKKNPDAYRASNKRNNDKRKEKHGKPPSL